MISLLWGLEPQDISSGELKTRASSGNSSEREQEGERGVDDYWMQRTHFAKNGDSGSILVDKYKSNLTWG